MDKEFYVAAEISMTIQATYEGNVTPHPTLERQAIVAAAKQRLADLGIECADIVFVQDVTGVNDDYDDEDDDDFLPAA